jgi:putative copper export protein
MNGAQLHLMLNHLPVMGTLFSLLLLAWSLIRRSAEIQKLALAIALLAGLSSVPAYLTGEPAEEVIEHTAGVDEAYIEGHESMGKFALWCGVALGVAAGAALAAGVKNPRWLSAGTAITLLASVLVFGVMGYTAHLGGQIRHPEIRDGAIQPTPTESHETEAHEE